MRVFYSTDELIQFYVHGFRVLVLGILYEKNHEEGNDCGARIDHQLPRVAESK